MALVATPTSRLKIDHQGYCFPEMLVGFWIGAIPEPAGNQGIEQT